METASGCEAWQWDTMKLYKLTCIFSTSLTTPDLLLLDAADVEGLLTVSATGERAGALCLGLLRPSASLFSSGAGNSFLNLLEDRSIVLEEI